MTDRTMTGVFPVLHIPYDPRGNVEEEDLRRQADLNVDAGVDGVAIAMGSSVVNLTESERDSVLKTVVDQVSGRVNVVMNTGAESTDVALHLSRKARDLGADALMVWLPTYFPAELGSQLEYFLTIANTVDLPIFIQDQPSSPCPPALMVRLADEHRNLCYAKVETPPTPSRVAELAQLRTGTAPAIFGGYGGFFTVEEFRRGAVGTFPCAAIPEFYVRMWRLWQQGDEEGTEEEFRRCEGILRTMHWAGAARSGSVYREILVRRGVAKSSFNRRPSSPLGPVHVAEIEREMDRAGLLAG